MPGVFNHIVSAIPKLHASHALASFALWALGVCPEALSTGTSNGSVFPSREYCVYLIP